VLQGAVQGIAELITRPGLINVDFADVRTVMSETGMAMMGSGAASGENRAREAAEAAVSSPLLEDINLAGAQGILVNVTAGLDLSIGEFEEVGNIVKEYASEDATVVVGTVIDPEMSNQIRVTVVATGLGRPVHRHSRERGAPLLRDASMRPARNAARCAMAVRAGEFTRRTARRLGQSPWPRCSLRATIRHSTSRRSCASARSATACARTRRPRKCWISRHFCGARRIDTR
jgi:cell division GTPase FtsZ